MKTIYRILMSVGIVMCGHVYAGDLDNIISVFKGVGSTLDEIGKGLASMGGYISGDQIYNYRVINNTSSVVNVFNQNVSMIMGAPISGGVGKRMSLISGQDSGAMFYNTHLYFKIEIPEAHFSESHMQMSSPNDTNIYLYNVYEDVTGIHAEAVGGDKTVPMTTDFNGIIYNGGSHNIPFTFTITCTGDTDDDSSNISENIATQSYAITVPLESDTYNVLTSQTGFAIRPSFLKTPVNQILVTGQGLGIEAPSSLIPTQTIVYPNRYNYEILPSNKIVQTGFSIGNFKQAKNGKLRTITPTIFTIWSPDAGDLILTDSTQSILLPYTSPNISIWALYTGSIYSVKQKKLIDKPIIKVPTGKAVPLYIMRPPVSRKKDMLYIFVVRSPSDNITRDLLSQFLIMPIPRFTQDGLTFKNSTGRFTYKLPSGIASNTDLFTLFSAQLPDRMGEFSKNGASAYLVYQKTFGSYTPSVYPMYCTACLPSYDPLRILSTIIQFLDPTVVDDAVEQTILTTIPTWISQMFFDPVSVQSQLQSYLVKYGPSTLTRGSGAQQSLNVFGNIALAMILFGPCSLTRLPLLYKMASVVSQAEPDDWVSPENVIPC